MTTILAPSWYESNIGGTQNRRKRLTPRRKSQNLEHHFQVQLVVAVRKVNPRAVFRAIPNGGARHVRVAMKLKSEGVKRGTPDLFFLLPEGRTGWLELKAPKGTLTKEQEDFRDACYALGHLWEFAPNFDTAWGVLAGWGVVPSEITNKGVAL